MGELNVEVLFNKHQNYWSVKLSFGIQPIKVPGLINYADRNIGFILHLRYQLQLLVVTY